ncbi:MAG: 2,3-bisphosphoglycerate-dependent phosphoglycerate mutase [Gaiellaceae bacterium]|nr:2,3-bisphosphoglycerate-dependent phosphoglycerate mutase [Gaiellaceae bacterium]
MELYVLARHGESTLNFENRINGDPAVPVALTEKGRTEARLLGEQLAHVRLDLCVHTRFARTLETAEIALAGREVPLELEPLLDDIDVGELEGDTIEEYRAWKREHDRRDSFPGGESLDAAARRYAEAFRKLLKRKETSILVVTHEIPVRYALNAAADSNDLDGPAHQLPNATPYVFDKESLNKAAERIEALAAQ